MKLPKLIWLMCMASVSLMTVSPVFVQEAIAVNCSWCPSPTNYSDPIGEGNGTCGDCEDIVKTRTVYPCAYNGNPASTCTNVSKQNRSTYNYSCHGPNAAGVAAAKAVWAGCVGGAPTICAVICATGAVPACLACTLIAIADNIISDCGCDYNEAICPCAYDGFDRGYGPGCS